MSNSAPNLSSQENSTPMEETGRNGLINPFIIKPLFPKYKSTTSDRNQVSSQSLAAKAALASAGQRAQPALKHKIDNFHEMVDAQSNNFIQTNIIYIEGFDRNASDHAVRDIILTLAADNHLELDLDSLDQQLKENCLKQPKENCAPGMFLRLLKPTRFTTSGDRPNRVPMISTRRKVDSTMESALEHVQLNNNKDRYFRISAVAGHNVSDHADENFINDTQFSLTPAVIIRGPSFNEFAMSMCIKSVSDLLTTIPSAFEFFLVPHQIKYETTDPRGKITKFSEMVLTVYIDTGNSRDTEDASEPLRAALEHATGLAQSASWPISFDAPNYSAELHHSIKSIMENETLPRTLEPYPATAISGLQLGLTAIEFATAFALDNPNVDITTISAIVRAPGPKKTHVKYALTSFSYSGQQHMTQSP